MTVAAANVWWPAVVALGELVSSRSTSSSSSSVDGGWPQIVGLLLGSRVVTAYGVARLLRLGRGRR